MSGDLLQACRTGPVLADHRQVAFEDLIATTAGEDPRDRERSSPRPMHAHLPPRPAACLVAPRLDLGDLTPRDGSAADKGGELHPVRREERSAISAVDHVEERSQPKGADDASPPPAARRGCRLRRHCHAPEKQRQDRGPPPVPTPGSDVETDPYLRHALMLQTTRMRPHPQVLTIPLELHVIPHQQRQVPQSNVRARQWGH